MLLDALMADEFELFNFMKLRTLCKNRIPCWWLTLQWLHLAKLQNIQIDNNFVEVGLVDDYQTTTKRTKVHGSIYSS